MVIYDTFGNVVLDIEVDDTSVAYEALKGDSTLTLKYSLDRHVEVPLGAFCTFEGKTYSLMAPEDVTMHNRRNFEYTLVMYSDAAKAKRYMFVNQIDGRLKFSLTATPREHLQMFVDNMNKRDGGWSIGECEDHVEIVLSYNHTYCHDALVQLADELKLDYWFDGKKVSLGKLELNKDNPLALSYGGDGAGLKSGTKRVNYSNALPVEVLYVQGTDVNIDPSRYGAAELHLPKSVQIGYDGAHFSDESGYNSGSARWYKTDDKGSSVRRADKQQTTYAEDSLDCTEIEPTQELTVLDVLAIDAGKHFYDIMVYSDFDYNDYIIAGEKPTIVFQSGELAGKEFDLATDKDGNLVRRHPSGFTENYWVFEIVPQEIDGITMPDDASGFMVKRNDTFKIFGIQLPDEYISNASAKSGAEWDMLRYAIKYLYANEDQQFTLTGELDEIYAKRNWAGIRDRIALGSYVSFYDRSFQQEPVLIRIIGIKRFVNKPYSPVIEISNSVVGGTLLGTINRIQNQEVYNEEMYQQGINYTKRRWRDARETMDMLEHAMLTGFTDAISPITVQAMSMLVGDESLQFRFVDSIDDPDTVSPTIRYDKLTKKVLSSGDIIQHMTLGIESVSNTHAANEYKYWNVAASESDITVADKAYYVYIRASKSSRSAEFVISEEAIKMESEPGYYHFLTGILNRESEADRSFVSLYGFTEVLPGQITTDIIRDADSNLIIDLLNARITARNGAKIIGDVEFGTNSTGLSNLSEWQSLESEVGSLGVSVQKVQDQVDGVVENWSGKEPPTFTNEPVKNWKTDAEKIAHINDTYINIQEYIDDETTPTAGQAWRWCQCTDDSITDFVEVIDKYYNTLKLHWHPIADSDAVRALKDAAEASAAAKEAKDAADAASESAKNAQELAETMEYLKTTFPSSTIVAGGVIAASTIFVRDTSNVVKGMFNGGSYASNSTYGKLILAAGATGSSAASLGAATTRIYEKGKIISKDVDLEGKITATSGSFTGSITATSFATSGFAFGNAKIDSIGFHITNSVTDKGTHIDPGYIEVGTATRGNTGSNRMTSSALIMGTGMIEGMRPKTRIVNSGTLLSSDHTIIVTSNTATINLPLSPVEGMEFRICKRSNSGTLTINGNGKSIYNMWNGTTATTFVSTNSNMIDIVWDGTYWLANYGH